MWTQNLKDLNTLKRNANSNFVRQAVSFSVIGAINTVVGLSVFYFLIFSGGLPAWLANLLGHAVAVAVSFLLNSKVTFKKSPTLYRAFKFGVCFAVSLAANLIVLIAGISTGIRPEIAQLPAMVTYTVTFFLISRYIVFR